MHIAKRQRLIAKAMPLFQQKQLHFPQHFAAGDWFAGIFCRAHQNEIFRKKCHFGQGRFRHWQGQDRSIKPPLRQFLQQLRGHRFAHLHL